MSRNYLNSFQFREDDARYLERLDRALSSEAVTVSPSEASAGNLPPDEPISLSLDRGDISSVARVDMTPDGASDGLRKSEGGAP